MKFFAVRHGLTELNKKNILNGRIDEPLALEGIQQAQALVSLIPTSVVHIYVSTLVRAKQTAEILNESLALPLSLHIELQEVHFGALTGSSWGSVENGAALRKLHKSVQYDYRPEGESAQEVKERVVQFVRQIDGAHADGGALLVVHGGIIRVLQHLERGESDDEIKNAVLHEFDTVKILQYV